MILAMNKVKKYILIFIAIFLLLSLSSCSGESKVDNITTEDELIVSDDNSDDIYEEFDLSELLDDENSTVVITYRRERKEIQNDSNINEMIENVINCDEIPDVEIISSVGTLSIKNEEKDKFQKIANLYIGKDDNIYAKSIYSDSDAASKLNIEQFGFEN